MQLRTARRCLNLGLILVVSMSLISAYGGLSEINAGPVQVSNEEAAELVGGCTALFELKEGQSGYCHYFQGPRECTACPADSYWDMKSATMGTSSSAYNHPCGSCGNTLGPVPCFGS
jgi:hypothetical protein